MDRSRCRFTSSSDIRKDKSSMPMRIDNRLAEASSQIIDINNMNT